MSLLILIRHGKAADGEVDVERPLTGRGRRDAASVGRFLAGAGIQVGRAVVSPALRARQTWDAAQAEFSGGAELLIDERIYDNDVTALLEIIRETPDGVDALVLVGHNPSFEQLAHDLDDGTGDPQARQALTAGYPTSAVAIFDCGGSWTGVQPHAATLRSFTVARSG